MDCIGDKEAVNESKPSPGNFVKMVLIIPWCIAGLLYASKINRIESDVAAIKAKLEVKP